jgi:hypothetical protein
MSTLKTLLISRLIWSLMIGAVAGHWFGYLVWRDMRDGPPFALGVYPFTLCGAFVGFVIGLAWDDYHRTAPPDTEKPFDENRISD